MKADESAALRSANAASPIAGAGGRARRGTFKGFRYRNFRFLWLGQVSNSASLWIEQVALPLLVLHLVPSPVEGAIHLGLVLGARTLPQLGFGLIGGVLADWYDRRMLLLVSKTISMLINVCFATVIVLGPVELWQVYVAILLRAIATSFDQPARQALIPGLVPPDDLANAVALNSASMQTMRIGGGPIAGFLVAFTGFSGAFIAVAVCSASAVLFTYLMRVPPLTDDTSERSVKAAGLSFWQGAKYGWGDPAIRESLLLLMVSYLVGMAYLQVFAPLFAKHVLLIGDTGYALMVTTAGIGALAGLLVIATFPPAMNRGRILLALLGLLGLLLMGFGFSTYFSSPLATFAFIGMVGLLQSSFFAIGTTVLLEKTRPEMLGRIMGLLSLDRSTITAGAAIAGLLSALLGPQLAQILFGAACVGFALLLTVVQPSMRKLQ